MDGEEANRHEAGPDRPREQVREGFARGALPTALGELWAGSGTGSTCRTCGRVIKVSEVEYEVIQNASRFPMHLECFRLWKEELDLRDEA